jgi:hypothetical protein
MEQKGIEDKSLQEALVSSLYMEIVFFKNPAFKDEGEVRWVYTEEQNLLKSEGIPLAPKHFRISHNILVPYATSTEISNLPRGKKSPVAEEDSQLLPLREVVVGPQENANLVKQSIEEFLQENGYDSVAVKKSIIPFRPTR